MTISDELRAGIEAYHRRIEKLGGYGTRVRATMPNGVVVEGMLSDRGGGGCQPTITRDDGKRFAILDLSALEVMP